MTKVLDIITSAYRESNLTPISAPITDPQKAEALARLNVIVASAYGNEVGDPLTDISVGDACSGEITNNSRLTVALTAAKTLAMPSTPSDGTRVAVIDPSGALGVANLTLTAINRLIDGQPELVLATGGLNRTWFFRADLGHWVALTGLEAGELDEFPFPMEFDDYFITRLAMRLNPRYGRVMTEESAVALASTLTKLRARYRQRVQVTADPALTRLTSNEGGFFSGSETGWMT